MNDKELQEFKLAVNRMASSADTTAHSAYVFSHVFDASPVVRPVLKKHPRRKLST